MKVSSMIILKKIEHYVPVKAVEDYQKAASEKLYE